jgi:hypothetical protein
MAKKYFDYDQSFYDNEILSSNLQPGEDWIHDYQGKPGERLTDVGQIKALMAEGKIKTDTGKFMDYFMSVSGGHNKLTKWKLNDYRSVSLVDAMGGYSKKGEWGPIRYSGIGGISDKARNRRMEGFANYLAATNYELNTKDFEVDAASMQKDMDHAALQRKLASRLNIVQNAQADTGENLNMGFGVRFKKALRGLSTANMLGMMGMKLRKESMQDSLTRAQRAYRANVYAPDATDPSTWSSVPDYSGELPDQNSYLRPDGSYDYEEMAKRRR